MPLILNIETTSAICSVCLANNGKLIDYRQDPQGNSHARALTVFIEEMLLQNKLAPVDIDVVAVSAGPGSYTGLRIGASVAKGLCYALNKPLVAVPTLLALANKFIITQNDSTAAYMPALDARRMDIYTAVYSAEGDEILSTRAVTVNEELENQLAQFGKLYVGGTGAGKCKPVFKLPQILYTGEVNCDARLMISIAETRALAAQFEDVAYFEPLYLKEFGAK